MVLSQTMVDQPHIPLLPRITPPPPALQNRHLPLCLPISSGSQPDFKLHMPHLQELFPLLDLSLDIPKLILHVIITPLPPIEAAAKLRAVLQVRIPTTMHVSRISEQVVWRRILRSARA